MAYTMSLGIPVERKRALDFGCGVGRLTQALAVHFDQVAGVDIAASMLKIARKCNRFGERCRYYLNDTDNLNLFPDGHFDFIYSNLVLQHMEPRYSKSYLREFVRILAPKGVLLFQLAGGIVQQSAIAEQPAAQSPSQSDPTAANIKRLVKSLAPRAMLQWYRSSKGNAGSVMEMYTVAREEVLLLMEESGARVVDVLEYDASGPGFLSFRYCVVKR